MRLARTASPLPRSLPGWNRTSGLRFPKPAGWPSPPQAEANRSTPGGSRTRLSRLRAGRHDRSTTGACKKKVGGPGIEPGPARYQRAVPPRTPASDCRKLRQQGSNLRFASNSRASCRSTTPERNPKRKERESNPRGPKAHPFSRRDTAPSGSPSARWLRQASNLHPAD
jgi:hypothetical protein